MKLCVLCLLLLLCAESLSKSLKNEKLDGFRQKLTKNLLKDVKGHMTGGNAGNAKDEMVKILKGYKVQMMGLQKKLKGFYEWADNDDIIDSLLNEINNNWDDDDWMLVDDWMLNDLAPSSDGDFLDGAWNEPSSWNSQQAWNGGNSVNWQHSSNSWNSPQAWNGGNGGNYGHGSNGGGNWNRPQNGGNGGNYGHGSNGGGNWNRPQNGGNGGNYGHGSNGGGNWNRPQNGGNGGNYGHGSNGGGNWNRPQNSGNGGNWDQAGNNVNNGNGGVDWNNPQDWLYPNTGDNGGYNGNTDNTGNGGSNTNTETATSTPQINGGTFVNKDVCGQRQTEKRSILLELRKLLTPETENGGKFQSRIVNGKTAAIAEFPWVVYLQVPAQGGAYYMCGGSLISEYWVLTAAHCLESLGNIDQFTVRIGEHDFQSDVEKHQDVSVSKTIIHPDYNSITTRNDIALVKLSEAANVAMPHINTICLSEQGFSIGTECIVAGWGNTMAEGDQTSDVLQRADIRIERQTKCPYSGGLDDTQLCAGGFTSQNSLSLPDSCQGDSGGPLFCPRDGVYVQAGIVSYGAKCGDPSVLGVYTDVTKYISWISSKINSN